MYARALPASRLRTIGAFAFILLIIHLTFFSNAPGALLSDNIGNTLGLSKSQEIRQSGQLQYPVTEQQSDQDVGPPSTHEKQKATEAGTNNDGVDGLSSKQKEVENKQYIGLSDSTPDSVLKPLNPSESIAAVNLHTGFVTNKSQVRNGSYDEWIKRYPKHYPPWQNYYKQAYDPNMWHLFEIDQDFHTTTVTESIDSTSRKVVPINVNATGGVACMGPRQKLLEEDTALNIYGYEMDPESFAKPFMGSHAAIGLEDSICFDRAARFRPYGLGDSKDPSKTLGNAISALEVDWENVNWKKLQTDCADLNSDSHSSTDNTGALTHKIDPAHSEFLSRLGIEQTLNIKKRTDDLAAKVLGELNRAKDVAVQVVEDHIKTSDVEEKPVVNVPKIKNKPGRSAVVLRAYDGYKYHADDLHSMRSLIVELALAGRGEYEIFLMHNVKNKTMNIHGDADLRKRILYENIPREFHDITILWNEDDCQKLYPNLRSNDVYFNQFQPLQYFLLSHPEFDYVWNWEMDARYIGHTHVFLKGLVDFARSQPRKRLWERSSRFWFPKAHPTWANFSSYIENLLPKELSIWGAVPSLNTPTGTQAKVSAVVPPGPISSNEHSSWGVGEEADLITLLPMFNPENTYWSYRDKTVNFTQGTTTPRRTFINTLSRLSTRMIKAMHQENEQGRAMASEMWPASVALHYGLKVVYAPHPIYSSRKWDPAWAQTVFNPGSEIAPGTDLTSPYSPDREHNFATLSWYFYSGFSGALYRRWLGWKVKGPEGSDTFGAVKRQWDNMQKLEGFEEGSAARMCLPGMLLHPVKGMDFAKRLDWVG